MSCYNCHHTPCTCHNSCNSCTSVVAGCPVQLDAACVFYHKDNASISELPNLGITNGATLELILETIDTYIDDLNVSDFSLPILRVSYVINSLQQFAEAVDTEFGVLAADVATALSNSQESIVANDSATIDFTTSGTLDHTITAAVKLSSSVSDNLITAQVDGIHVAPQTLSVNYSTHELTISDGNTINFSSLVSAPAGFLGNVTSDPSSPADGEYWFRTDLSASVGLKIRLNGSTRTITTS